MKDANLRSMSVEALMALRDRINMTLSARVHSERRELEMRLQRLNEFSPNQTPGKRGPKKGTKVAPKYRNPANRLETWTGRGRQPRWVVAALKGGKRLSDLLIAETTPAARKRQK